MKLHGNARTCPKSRRFLIDRLEGDWSLTETAEAAGVSERTARQVACPLARRRGAGAPGPKLSAPQGSRPYSRDAGRGDCCSAPPADDRSRDHQAKGAGWERVHVCVDDATRLAYVEVLDDEKARTSVGFLKRALAFYAAHGITVERVMTDNGPGYTSIAHAIACRALGIRHIRTRPFRPRTNGKAERLIRTMLGGWAYGAIYRDSAQRTAALSGWLDFYNLRRPHGSLSHKPPGARLAELNNVAGSYN
jgi:hypothetical protein